LYIIWSNCKMRENNVSHLHSINKSHHVCHSFYDMGLCGILHEIESHDSICHKHGMMMICTLSLGLRSYLSADCLSFSQVCMQKQSLERDLEDVRGKLKNTETDLRESQKRETQTEAKLMVQQHAQSH